MCGGRRNLESMIATVESLPFILDSYAKVGGTGRCLTIGNFQLVKDVWIWAGLSRWSSWEGLRTGYSGYSNYLCVDVLFKRPAFPRSNVCTQSSLRQPLLGLKKRCMSCSVVSHKEVRSMEVRGAQNIHSLDETKHHPFVTPGCFLLLVALSSNLIAMHAKMGQSEHYLRQSAFGL